MSDDGQQWETYEAIVSRIDQDEPKVGKIFCIVPGILGDDETELDIAIDPVFDWSWFYVPDIGEEVEVEILVGDDQQEDVKGQATIDNLVIRWRSKRFLGIDKPDLAAGKRLPHELFTSKNYGKRRGFGTPQGHVFFFDDTDDDKQITLAWRETPTSPSFSQLTMDKDGSIILLNKNGSIMFLDAKNAQAMISDEHGNSYSSDANGIKVIDIFNNSIEFKDGVITVLGATDTLIKAGGNVVVDAGSDLQATVGGDLNATVTGQADITAADASVTCGALILDGDTVDIAKGASEPAVRGAELNTYMTSKLTVGTAFGPSGPSTVPLGTGAELSTVTTLECSIWSVLLTLTVLFWWMQ